VRFHRQRTLNNSLVSASRKGGRSKGWPPFFLAFSLLCGDAKNEVGPGEDVFTQYDAEIVDIREHDPRAFTQGLAFWQGDLFEGTGRRGQSALRRIDLEAGRVLDSRRLPDAYFGEGVTVFRGTVYQLTWKAGLCFTYDARNLKPLRSFKYEGEGWGLTHDGTSLILSDGSSRLRFMSPESFEEKRRVSVQRQGEAVTGLNELEYIDGLVYANVWRTDFILIIDPSSGKAVGEVDLSGLLKRADRVASKAGVLNGIAFDGERDRLFVTGKCWPNLFQIRLTPKQKIDASPPVQLFSPIGKGMETLKGLGPFCAAESLFFLGQPFQRRDARR